MQIHPVAERMPAMSADEYTRLVADIRAHGQREPITLLEGAILDGRHRAKACADLGIEVRAREFDGDPADAEAYVLSLNVHRRHLSTEQKRMVIEYELRRDPSQSDRSIAEKAAVHHETVGTARAALEEGGGIRHHAERVGKDGVKQPATKQPPKPAPGNKSLAERAEQIRELAAEGHNIHQIAEMIGVGHVHAKRIADEYGVRIAIPRAGKNAATLSVSRVVTETVNVIAGTVQGIEMLRNSTFSIERGEAADLARDLSASMRSIRWLEQRLKGVAHG